MTTDLDKAKLQKLYKELTEYRGSGTSMVSFIIRHDDQLSKAKALLTTEEGTAVNIKSRVNKLSVLAAISAAKEKLKLYSSIPENGLIIYCGTAEVDGKDKKLAFAFEPFRPINYTMYRCDNRFHTECLDELFTESRKYGFIIADGNGYLFATLQGTTKKILSKLHVTLPGKISRGGQSRNRFQHISDEKRHNFVRKVCEVATQLFITEDKPNVIALFVAGMGSLKTKIRESPFFDPRLGKIVVKVIDVAYGHEKGLYQAINDIAPTLPELKYNEEKKVLEEYMDHLAKNTGLVVYGRPQIRMCIEMSAVEKLIVCQDLILEDEKKELEDLLENPQGYEVAIVSTCTELGHQFMHGFGGIGGILRYKVSDEVFASLSGEDGEGVSESVEEGLERKNHDDFDFI